MKLTKMGALLLLFVAATAASPTSSKPSHDKY